MPNDFQTFPLQTEFSLSWHRTCVNYDEIVDCSISRKRVWSVTIPLLQTIRMDGDEN
jgi:hypothetical protein